MADQEDELREVGRLLDELAQKHIEMANLCAHYQELIGGVVAGTADEQVRNTVRELPGARYRVANTFAQNQTIRIQAVLQSALAEQGGPESADAAEEAIMEALRAAGEPVREAVLFERVHARGADASAGLFQACLVKLESEGHVRMRVERKELAGNDPEPFGPRYYWAVA